MSQPFYFCFSFVITHSKIAKLLLFALLRVLSLKECGNHHQRKLISENKFIKAIYDKLWQQKPHSIVSKSWIDHQKQRKKELKKFKNKSRRKKKSHKQRKSQKTPKTPKKNKVKQGFVDLTSQDDDIDRHEFEQKVNDDRAKSKKTPQFDVHKTVKMYKDTALERGKNKELTRLIDALEQFHSSFEQAQVLINSPSADCKRVIAWIKNLKTKRFGALFEFDDSYKNQSQGFNQFLKECRASATDNNFYWKLRKCAVAERKQWFNVEPITAFYISSFDKLKQIIDSQHLPSAIKPVCWDDVDDDNDEVHFDSDNDFSVDDTKKSGYTTTSSNNISTASSSSSNSCDDSFINVDAGNYDIEDDEKPKKRYIHQYKYAQPPTQTVTLDRMMQAHEAGSFRVKQNKSEIRKYKAKDGYFAGRDDGCKKRENRNCNCSKCRQSASRENEDDQIEQEFEDCETKLSHLRISYN